MNLVGQMRLGQQARRDDTTEKAQTPFQSQEEY